MTVRGVRTRNAQAVALVDARLARLTTGVFGQGGTVARNRYVRESVARWLLDVRALLTDEPYEGPRPWERNAIGTRRSVPTPRPTR